MSKTNLAVSTISASLDSERQRAMRAILQLPLLKAGGPDAEEYLLVRRHAQWLKEWFSRHPDWHFQVDSEVARLRKTPADPADGTRPATHPNKGALFTKRRYVLLCLALATLEQAERHIVLGNLADGVIELISRSGLRSRRHPFRSEIPRPTARHGRRGAPSDRL